MIGTDELAREIAKSSDIRDVQTYVHKEQIDGSTHILSIIRPVKFPERLRPLLNALSTAHAGILEVNAIDATLGEALVAFSSAGIHTGLAVIRPQQGTWIDEDQVKALFKQAGLSDWTFMDMDGIGLRTKLLQYAQRMKPMLDALDDEPLVLPIDQHFNVKGIGLVAIGYVQCGHLKVHDELTLLPAKGSGTVKSLQVMDDDVEIAHAGDRVGIALRNTKEEHLSGDTIIVHPLIDDKKTGTHKPLAVAGHLRSTVELTQSPFQKRVLVEGDVIHASVDLQFVVGRVKHAQAPVFEIEWEHPLYIRVANPQPALITQLDSKPRILGHATINLLE